MGISPGSSETKLVDSWCALSTLNKQTFVENSRETISLMRGLLTHQDSEKTHRKWRGYPASCEKIQGLLHSCLLPSTSCATGLRLHEASWSALPELLQLAQWAQEIEVIPVWMRRNLDGWLGDRLSGRKAQRCWREAQLIEPNK